MNYNNFSGRTTITSRKLTWKTRQPCRYCPFRRAVAAHRRADYHTHAPTYVHIARALSLTRIYRYGRYRGSRYTRTPCRAAQAAIHDHIINARSSARDARDVAQSAIMLEICSKAVAAYYAILCSRNMRKPIP